MFAYSLLNLLASRAGLTKYVKKMLLYLWHAVCLPFGNNRAGSPRL
jgi:hypothetical protein